MPHPLTHQGEGDLGFWTALYLVGAMVFLWAVASAIHRAPRDRR
jgi:hypothetical protein